MGQDDPLEKEPANCSCILAWRIPWAEEPGGLQYRGSEQLDTTEATQHTRTRVRNNWQIHSKELWGKELQFDIWEIVQTINVSVFHVDAHSVPNSTEQWYRCYYRGTNLNPSSRSWSRLQWLKRFDFVGTPENVAIWGKKQHTGGLRIKVFLLTMALIKFVILT